MTTLEIIKKCYQQRELAAREWKNQGGQVAGYFCNRIPEEMIMAAGIFPYRISGDPKGTTEAADKYTEPFYEGFVRSMLNMVLTGSNDFLDFIIIPHSRDSIAAMHTTLQEIKDLEPELRMPELYFYETLHTGYYSSEHYNRARMSDLRKQLEAWSGKRITATALSRAIDITNENRTLLSRIAELRISESPRITGQEALQIIGASMFMSKEKHNKLLTGYLDEADRLPEKQEVRLFVTGSPMDNLQLYELVEKCNAIVVAEDNCWGNRYADNPINTSLKPMTALGDKYQLNTTCPWMYSMGRRAKYITSKIVSSRAQGVIFFMYEYDYVQAYDYPDIKKALEEKGIPSICIRDQKYLISGLAGTDIQRDVSGLVKHIRTGMK